MAIDKSESASANTYKLVMVRSLLLRYMAKQTKILPVNDKHIKTTISDVCIATLITLLVSSIPWEASIEECKIVTRKGKCESLEGVKTPANFDRRNIIRKTWASDPSLKARWKTMFLLGQAVGDSTEKKYLEDEGLKYGDFIRGTQNENYYNLTLKTQMGVEWAAKYCDFQFLLKADDDVFVNPYRLMEYLGNSDTPKTELYLGRVASSGIVHRRGKYAVSVEEYNGTRYPAFCNGPAYLLSWDLVNKLVDLFDVKKPLKLEDVYIGTLVDKLGVKPVRHRGFRLLQFGSSSCKHYSDTVVYHKASIQCTEELFNEAMKERAEEELTKSGTVNTGENISRLEIMTPKTI
ncbi:hypothetical protein ACROYT_G022517 [Oculina patagonica]